METKQKTMETQMIEREPMTQWEEELYNANCIYYMLLDGFKLSKESLNKAMEVYEGRGWAPLAADIALRAGLEKEIADYRQKGILPKDQGSYEYYKRLIRENQPYRENQLQGDDKK